MEGFSNSIYFNKIKQYEQILQTIVLTEPLNYTNPKYYNGVNGKFHANTYSTPQYPPLSKTFLSIVSQQPTPDTHTFQTYTNLHSIPNQVPYR